MEVTRSRYQHKNSQPAKKKLRTRNVVYALVAVIFLGSLFAYSYLAINKSVAAADFGEYIIGAPEAMPAVISWPKDGQAAIGDLDEGLQELANNRDQQAPIASMSKLITALVILDKSPISASETGKSYVITENDITIYHNYVAKLGSVMPVHVGQSITQFDLLQGLLLSSGNNAADYLATWKFGSIDAYKNYANEYLSRNSLNNTHVDDASGFSPLTVSSPSDMIEIGQMALKNEVIREIVAKESAVIPGSGELNNSNQMLSDSNVVGIKTGLTDEAGGCLIFAVKHGPGLSKTLIGVVMGQSNWTNVYASARAMSQSVLANYGNIELLSAQTSVANIETKWGDSSNLIVHSPLAVYGRKSKEYKLKLDIRPIIAPIKSGEKVGRIFIEGNSDISQDVYIENSLSKPSIAWRLLNS